MITYYQDPAGKWRFRGKEGEVVPESEPFASLSDAIRAANERRDERAAMGEHQ